MLGGIFRKLSLPILLLSLIGWILYVVGFGFRNASYQDVTGTTAAAPDYFFLWVYLCTGPVIYFLAFLHSFWESKVSALLAVVLGPLFLVSLGVVLFLNGLQLYAFFLTNSSDEGSAIGSSDNSTDINLFCVDARANGQNEIFGEERYVLIEFVGALVSVLFFWVYMMFVPFFSNKTLDDPYFGNY